MRVVISSQSHVASMSPPASFARVLRMIRAWAPEEEKTGGTQQLTTSYYTQRLLDAQRVVRVEPVGMRNEARVQGAVLQVAHYVLSPEAVARARDEAAAVLPHLLDDGADDGLRLLGAVVRH